MSQEFGICNLSIVPVRVAASDKSEILSQLLFGDGFWILEATEKWIRIKNSSDDYEGWIDAKQFQPVDEAEFTKLRTNSKVLGTQIYHQLHRESGDSLYLVSGSSIPATENGKFSIGNINYVFKTTPVYGSQSNFLELIESYSKFFLNAPYLWGGKSLFGIDCSGFTQVVFKMLGIQLKRDAWQQAEQGGVVNFLQEAKMGDLAFFDNQEGRIVHVGIMLNEKEIIHASGRVKIDRMDNQGIYSMDLGKHTHKLRIIKRFTEDNP